MNERRGGALITGRDFTHSRCHCTLPTPATSLPPPLFSTHTTLFPHHHHLHLHLHTAPTPAHTPPPAQVIPRTCPTPRLPPACLPPSALPATYLSRLSAISCLPDSPPIYRYRLPAFYPHNLPACCLPAWLVRLPRRHIPLPRHRACGAVAPWRGTARVCTCCYTFATTTRLTTDLHHHTCFSCLPPHLSPPRTAYTPRRARDTSRLPPLPHLGVGRRVHYTVFMVAGEQAGAPPGAVWPHLHLHLVAVAW